MPAFDPVKSGIPGLDKAIDHIRLGDNVVLRVSSLADFRAFVLPFVRQAAADHRNILYVRFADHAPILTDEEAAANHVRVVKIPLSHRFETFTVDVHRLIETEGYDAFYVFDCLSVLTTAWATDLMMGNFFRVTCPFLFRLNTVAYFPILRGHQALSAVAKVQDTCQVFIDVYPAGQEEGALYVRPDKVWNRYAETMFLPHVFHTETNEFRPILDGVGAAAFYDVLGQNQREAETANTDSWDRFFHDARKKAAAGEDMTRENARMCQIMMSRDEQMRELIRRHFMPADYFAVKDKMIGTGMIGGKACGMLTARMILRNTRPDIYARLEPHDSFYVGSDVFYSYLVDNGLWDLRVRQREPEHYFALAPDLQAGIMKGSFSSGIEQRILALLEYYGQDPYIVRSSSILEDGFGNAFAGKYESVFCANQGPIEDRLREFEHAARIVYASTMSPSALEYRKRRGLEGRDEQMALLVQRVSGSTYGALVMPCAAGVGYSTSPYKPFADTDVKAGMLRLVCGLGTSAVDRTEGSYPRIVSLDRPTVTTATTIAERHKFSQRRIECVSRREKALVQVTPEQLSPLLPPYITRALYEHDTDAEYRLRETGHPRPVTFVSCKGLVSNADLMADMRGMLDALEDEYRHPVDTEFTINLDAGGHYVINLLQCRPLQSLADGRTSSGSGKTNDIMKIIEAGEKSNTPEASALVSTDGTGIAPDDKSTEGADHSGNAVNILLHTSGASMGLSTCTSVDTIVYIDPREYYALAYEKKAAVARLLGEVNKEIGENGAAVLFSPGRLGTSSPELGVPAAFADIDHFTALCEIAESKYGYNPELSYGSHMFQDLVETGILYVAVFEGKSTKVFRPEALRAGEKPDPALPLYVTHMKNCLLLHDMEKEQTVLCQCGP